MEKETIKRLKYLIRARRENPIRDVLIYCRRAHGKATYRQIAEEVQLTPARVREIYCRLARKRKVMGYAA